MRAFALLAVCSLLAACDKPAEPQPSGDKPTPSPATATAKAAATAKSTAAPAATGGAVPTDMAWDAPSVWHRAETTSPMRKATYAIPKAAGDSEDAEMTVSQAGGSTEANVKRWEGQFEDRTGETKREEKKVGDLKVTVIEIRGKFAGGGMPGAPPSGPKPGWAMLAAIVETQPPHFFKLTGPEKTVTGARAEFDKMVGTFRPK